MLHLSSFCNYYLHRMPTDMRKGFDGLCGIVTSGLKMDALNGSVFIFINKKRNQLKLLLWEGDGFAVYHKRLEKGTFEIPHADNQSLSISISARQLQFILQGVSLQKVRFRPRYQKIA